MTTKMTKQQLIDENAQLRAALEQQRVEIEALKAQASKPAAPAAPAAQAAEALTLGQRAAAMAKRLGCTVYVDAREGMFYTKRQGVRHDLAAV